MPKTLTFLLTSAVLMVALAACGGSNSTSSASSSSASTAASSSTSASSSAAAPAAGSGTVLPLAADPGGQLKYSSKSLSAKAGTVEIKFTNMAPEMHNVTIQKGTNGPVVGATPTFTGGSRTLTAKLKPGTYTFYCSVPGHRAGGMQGTLTVK
jgi:plastocyanin